MLMDILFILLFIGGLALGFYQGVVRLGVLLIAYYLSIVLASILFYPLGMFFFNQFGTIPSVGFYVAFALVAMISLAALSAYGIYVVRDYHAKLHYIEGPLMYADRVAGVFVSLILTSLFLGMLGMMLWNMFIVKGAAQIDLPLMRILGASVNKSFLLNYFATYILPTAYNFADPILPDGAAIIFAVAQ